AGRVGAAHDVGVARLRADGQLDTAYANQGRLSFDLGGQENLLDLQVDAQQRAWLLVARSGGATLVRLTPAGAFDAGFGDGGKLALANDIAVLGFALDGQGRILLGGVHYGQVHYEMAVRRLRADGSIDGNFGSQGLTLVSPDLRANVQKLAVLADGRILAVGNSSGGASIANIGRMTVARLLDDGHLDTSYGTGGVRVIDFAGEERSISYPDTRIALGADGKLTIARSVIEPVAAIRLARLLPDGQPDAGFAPDGKRTALQGSYYLQTLARVFATPTRLLVAGVYNQNSQRTFYATAWRDGDSIFRGGPL
uniref:hypothetical protein n=1 Tax=Tahibacter caeni TaxID=1453545 RepID=UPI00214732D8